MRDHRRSRLIRWLRVLFPLGALALLSVLFLAARQPGPAPVLPYATGAPEDAARGAGIRGAEYSTTTADGGQVRIVASHAVPSGADGTARDLTMQLIARDGGETVLTAPEGRSEGGMISLSGGVRVTTPDGWVVTARSAEGEAEGGSVSAEGDVTADAPLGRLTADRATLRPDPASGGRVLDLNGRVRLIYQP